MPSGPGSASNLALKAIILFVLAILLGVPLLMIRGVMSERKSRHGEVVAEIARSTAGAQTVTGPLLLVRYRVRVRETSNDPEKGRPVERTRLIRRERVIIPDSLAVRADATIEERYRGIYKAQVVQSRDTLTAIFRVPPRYGVDEARDVASFDAARLVVGVTDARGLRRVPVITRDGAPLEVEPGSEFGGAPQGVSADLGDLSAGGTFSIEAHLDLTGTQQLMFTPVGKDTRVEMHSPWPHPGFRGGFLPDERTIGADGFSAVWQLSHFATGVEQAVNRCAGGQCDRLEAIAFGVGFVQPVDIYQQSERAVKYGMLFIGLTFVAFFVFEVLRRLLVHPIQYGLVGFALALFFLLVISLSEHVPFGVAYLLASLACVGLLAFYVGHVLHGAMRGIAFGAMLGGLYAVLYVLLQSEDYALLLGSLLLFAVLALVMFVTRRVDWYRIGDRSADAGSGAGA